MSDKLIDVAPLNVPTEGQSGGTVLRNRVRERENLPPELKELSNNIRTALETIQAIVLKAKALGYRFIGNIAVTPDRYMAVQGLLGYETEIKDGVTEEEVHAKSCEEATKMLLKNEIIADLVRASVTQTLDLAHSMWCKECADDTHKTPDTVN